MHTHLTFNYASLHMLIMRYFQQDYTSVYMICATYTISTTVDLLQYLYVSSMSVYVANIQYHVIVV